MGGGLAGNRFNGSLLAFVLLVVTFVVAAPQPALGTTFSVNPADSDCVPDGPGPAFCTVEGAVAAAAADGAGPHTITIAPGTHALSAELNLDFDVSIVGAGVGVTILDSTETSGSFASVTADAVVNMSLFTVSNATDSAIIVDGAQLTATNLAVRASTSNGVGGGLQAVNSAVVSVSQSTFEANSASDGAGAIAVLLGAAATIIDTTITGNTTSGLGGGLEARDAGTTVSLVRSSVLNNSGSSGGGIHVATGAVVSVTESTIDGNNSGLGGDGGGVRVDGTGSIINVLRSTISNNDAAEGGGGYATLGGLLDIRNSTVSNNIEQGLRASTTGTLYVLQSTVVGNFGVGIVADSTVDVGNGAPGDVILARVLLAGNEADGSAADCQGSVSLAAFNLIGTDAGCTLNGEGTGDIVGTLGAEVNALTLPLLDNGGATLTHALDPGSPAIDAAETATCQTPDDQRGVARPQGIACDIGAFELGAPGATLQAMINATPNGALLTVPDGTYFENVEISRGVRLTGSGPDTVVIDGDGTEATVTVDSDTAIANIRVTGGGLSGISVNGAFDVAIDGVVIDNNAGFNGGGLRVGAGAVVNVTDTAFTNNTATNGGAIWVNGTGVLNIGPAVASCAGAPTDATTFVGSTSFSGNFASSDGGAIQINGAATINDAEFNFNNAGSPSGNGGAIFVESGSDPVTIQCSVFDSNHAFADGGAIGGEDDGDVAITDSLFVSNSADERGGAISDFVDGTRLTILGSIFDTNSAGISGGAIVTTSTFSGINNLYLNNTAGEVGGAISVGEAFSSVDSQFLGNFGGSSGGAIFVDSSAVATISDATISGNDAASGGGVYAASDLVISDSTIDFNVALFGGGVYVAPTAGVIVENSLFQGNFANGGEQTVGGGIGVAGDLVVANSTFTGNRAPAGNGGGLGLTSGATADVSYVTFVDNSALVAGGAFNGDPGSLIRLFSSASQGNGSPAGPVCASFESLGFNVVGGNPSDCTFASTDVIALTGFEPLADNGGPTFTHAIGVTSPALDLVGSGITLEPISSIAPLTLNGSVGYGPAEQLRLTDSFTQAGTAFWSDAYPSGSSFEVAFDFQITPIAGLGAETSADGIAFVIASDPSVLGNVGGAIGIGGVPGVVSFEMDTYDGTTGGFGDDIDGNHLAINVGDTVESPNTNQVPVAVAFDNGSVWTAVVSYNSATQTLTGEVSESGVVRGTVSEIVDLGDAVDPSALYFGFSSATGGAAAVHDILAMTVSAPTGCSVATDQRGVVRPQGTACDAGAFEATQITATLGDVTLTHNSSDFFTELGVVDIPVVDIPIEKVTGDQADSPAEPSPLSTIPLSTIPLSTIDLNASPLSTIPLSTIPLSTIPLSTIALNGAPLSTIPLSSIPLSTIGWADVLIGTALEGEPLQSVTLDEVPLTVLELNDITLGDLRIQGSPLSTISLPSLALGDATVSEIDGWLLGGATVCGSVGVEYDCDNADTLLNLEVQGAPLSTIPLSTIPLTTIDLASTPLSTIPLSTIPLSTIPLSSIPLSTITVNGLPLSTIPLSTIDVSGAPLSTIPVDTVPLSTIDLLVSPLSTIPLSTIPLSTIPLSTITVDGQDFCDYYDAGAEAATSCAGLGLDLTTQGLGDLIAALGVLDPTLTIGASPLSTIPLSTIDVSTAPLSTIDFSNPVVQSSPLSTIPLSTILINGDPVCDYIASVSADTCATRGLDPSLATFVELSQAYGGISSSPLSTIPLSTIDLDSVPLSTINLQTVLLNGAPLSTIPLSTIDIRNSPLSTIPLSTIDMTTSPLSTIPLSTIDILGSPLSTIPLSTIPLSTIATCTIGTAGCVTLGDAFVYGFLDPTATLGDLDGLYGEATLAHLIGAFGDLTLLDIAELLGGMTLGELMDALTLSFLFGDLNLGEVDEFGNLTFGQLLIALMLRSDFPWESLPLDQLDPQEYTADNWLIYNLTVDVEGAGPDVENTASITIPQGFYYEPGSSVTNSFVVDIGGGPVFTPPDAQIGVRPELTGEPLADPVIVVNPDGSQTLTFAPTAMPVGERTVVSIITVPSLSYGLFDASADVALGAEPPAAADTSEAYVNVFESEVTDSGDDPANPAPTDADVLYIGHVSYSGDVDYFEITPPNEGDRVVVFMSNLDADGDLVLYKPLSAAETVPTSTTGPSLDGVPVEDDGVDFAGNTTEEPNTLEDVLLLDGQPIGGISTNRGTLDEEASAIATNGDPFIIQASMYNGATTQEPFVLRVKVNPEVPTPQCTPRGWAPSGASPAADTFGSFGEFTNNVFLMNWERIAQTEGVQAADDVRAALNALAARDDLGIVGVVLDVNSIAAGEYAAWDANPCDADAANDIVDVIVGFLDTEQATSPELTYVTIGGSDEIIPFARKADETAIANESTFAGEFSDNAMYGSLITRHFLSDDPYADLDPVPWLDRFLHVPDRSVGRLVESAADIVDAAQTFQDFGGFLDPETAQTVGYDFLSDSSEAIDQAFVDNGLSTGSALIDQPNAPLQWGLAELRVALGLTDPVLSDNSFIPDVLSLNMHFDFDESLTSRGDATKNQAGELFTVADLWDMDADEIVDLDGTIIFTVGCHSGTSVADVAVGQAEASQDWAQTMGAAGASYVAQNAYGLGDDTANALTERLMTSFAENLDGSMTIGQALTFAKQTYFADLGMYGEYDYKAMQAATFYGLPMYQVGSAPVAALALEGDITPTTDPVTGLSSTQISMDATDYTISETVTDNGTFFNVDGEAQFLHYRPLQPIVRMDVTADNGDIAQGAFLTSVTTRDLNVDDIAYAMPVVDQGALSPPVLSDEMSFPTTQTNVARYNAPPTAGGLFDERQQLNVMVGQFTSPLDGATNGVERLFESFDTLVYYSEPGSLDQKRPYITNVQGGVGGDVLGGTGQAVFAADVSDASGVSRVGVLYRQSVDSGVGQWVLADLVFDTLTNRWTGGGPVEASGLVDGEVDYMVQAVDSFGNVANSTFKGLFYVAKELPPPTTPGDGIQVEVSGDPAENGWFEGDVTIDPVDDSVEYEYSVDGSAFVPLPPGATIVVTGEGPHLVTIRTTDGSFSETFIILIDTSDPTIQIFEPSEGAFINQGAPVVADFLCSDGGSGVSTCIGTGGVDTSVAGPQTLTVTATDRAGHVATDSVSYTIRELVITGPITPLQVGGTADFSSPSVDSEIDTVTWDFGDGATCVVPDTACSQSPNDDGSVRLAASHQYTTTGVFEVKLTVTDEDYVQTASFRYVVVFDPSGGFVTGGGWIDSPSGAYTPNDLTDADLVGRANFGFVSKYKKGATVPDGNTSFEFDAAGLAFASESYEWLVIAGATARFKGDGYVEGDDQLYKFQVTGFDADVNDVFEDDGLRIKIWFETTEVVQGSSVIVEHVLYDSGLGVDDSSGPGATTELGGGSIVVHKPKSPGKK